MIILQGFINVPANELDAIKVALITHKQLTQQEVGCITFTVIQDKKNPCQFHVYEEFIDQLAFERHQARVKSSAWGEATKNVIRHYQISQKP